MTTPLPEVTFTLQEKLESLKNQLLEQNPGYATALAEILKITQNNPGFVYALSDEQIHTIVSGMEKHARMTIDVGKTVNKKQAALLDENSV